MKKFDVEFETKVQLEHARFNRGKLELEMQTKELETKHQGGRARARAQSEEKSIRERWCSFPIS